MFGDSPGYFHVNTSPLDSDLASLLGRLWQKAPRISQLFRSGRARLLTCHGPFHSILLDGFLQTLFRTLIHEKSIQDHAAPTAAPGTAEIGCRQSPWGIITQTTKRLT